MRRANNEAAYRDQRLPLDERVEDLLGRMTLAEKAQQLCMLARSWGTAESHLRHGRFHRATAAANLGVDGQGSLSQRSDEASARSYAESANAVQQYLVDETRLGIPALVIAETLHGLVGPIGATVFPQAIGLAATWNPDLVERIGAVIAAEARAVGTHVGLSPVLDVGREPRWGRLEETYGEDPYLVSRLGVAMIRGMQGDGRFIATVKHFAGHGSPQGGRDSAPSGHGREFLREYALPPFEAAVRTAVAGGVMAAYGDWCYVPCNASAELLTGILRQEWGFEGFVIEDMGAIRLLRDAHAVVEDYDGAARVALRAGVDQSFASEFGDPIAAAVAAGELPGELLDRAVRRILRAKFGLGLFEQPYVEPDEASAVLDAPGHRGLALEAARHSVVLLKNDAGVLPLSRALDVIAVIGPNADAAECGDYSGRNPHLVTPLAGIRALARPATTVRYAKGCDVVDLDRPVPVPVKHLTPSGTSRGFAPEPGATGLTAAYFGSVDFAAPPDLIRVEGCPDLSGDTAPVLSDGVAAVRWSGMLMPEVAGSYELMVESRGGIRLQLDGDLLIDELSDGGSVIRGAEPVSLSPNRPVPLVLDYVPGGDAPAARLLWRVAGRPEDFEEAVRCAADADVAVLVVGGSATTSGEIRDVGDLELTGRQDELIRAVHNTGTPLVLVHVGGRPNTMEWAFDHCAAALAAWLPGEEGGTAIAEVLFGAVNPSGKLPVQWPATTGQLPSSYDYMHTGRDERGNYVKGPVDPRYPFGHGMSFTSFEYGAVGTPGNVAEGEHVMVTVEVANTGRCLGTEVVQLYVRDLVATVKRPMRQLKDFRRVMLAAGERMRLTFTLSPEQLSYVDAAGRRVLEPGEFEVAIGGSSGEVRCARFRIC